MITIPIIFAPWFTKPLIIAVVILTGMTLTHSLVLTLNLLGRKLAEKKERRNVEFAKIASKTYAEVEKERKIIEMAMDDKNSPWGLNLS